MALPILTIVGATGTQGASVLSAFASDPTPQYHIRALTSNTATPAARNLASQPNTSVLAANLSSLDSLTAAFAGSALIFANTYLDPQIFTTQGAGAAQKHEAQQGLNIVVAASRTPSLKHLVWSTLPDGLKISGGRWDIPHFQSKVVADAYVLDGANGLLDKTTFLRVGLYSSNLLRPPYRPIFAESAKKHLVILPCPPDAPLPIAGHESKNIGLIARSIFAQPSKAARRTVLAVPELMSARDWAGSLSKAFRLQGRENSDVAFVECSLESFEEVWGPLGREVGLMFAYLGEVGREGFEGDALDVPVLTLEELGVEGLGSSVDCLAALDWD